MSTTDNLPDHAHCTEGPSPRPGFLVILLFALRHPRLTYKALLLYWLERRLGSRVTSSATPRSHTGLLTYSEAFVARHAEQRAQRILSEGAEMSRSITIRVQVVNQQVLARETAAENAGRTPIRVRDGSVVTLDDARAAVERAGPPEESTRSLAVQLVLKVALLFIPVADGGATFTFMFQVFGADPEAPQRTMAETSISVFMTAVVLLVLTAGGYYLGRLLRMITDSSAMPDDPDLVLAAQNPRDSAQERRPGRGSRVGRSRAAVLAISAAYAVFVTVGAIFVAYRVYEKAADVTTTFVAVIVAVLLAIALVVGNGLLLSESFFGGSEAHKNHAHLTRRIARASAAAERNRDAAAKARKRATRLEADATDAQLRAHARAREIRSYGQLIIILKRAFAGDPYPDSPDMERMGALRRLLPPPSERAIDLDYAHANGNGSRRSVDLDGDTDL